eukprot:TRINITY_DN683_c0_g3_i1.p1 TRINITY_DN683_c0_g3~~TRINITY_DN683_c0_g3_i1.p1  ORF type:complete len:1046 (-),score=408.02 TRINITY_DN683_c0_g3_i1:2-3139(-)
MEESTNNENNNTNNDNKANKIKENERIKELKKKEKERQTEIKKKQREALSKFREEQNKEIQKDSEGNKDNRLKYLIQQSEIFAHFMSNSKQKGSPIKKTQNKIEEKDSPRRSKIKENEEDKEMLENAIEDNQIGAIVTGSPSFIKNGEMRYYQIDGLNWLINLYDHGINGVLADEMGLGKTLQTISLIGYLKHVRYINGPHLVIVPKSTLTNWMNEFKKWLPSVKTLKFHGNKEERIELKSKSLVAGEFEVCVTTYEMIIIEKSAFKKFNWRYMVIDEAHRIKNENSKLSEIVRDVKSNNRLLLTGTPLQNNLHELWALLNFLLPDVFSSSEDFDSWFDVNKSKETVEKLHMILKPFLLRRLKNDVEMELLPKKEIKLYVGLSKMQREWYKNVLMKDVDVVINDENKEGEKKKTGNKLRLMNIAMQLRKVCNHPYLFEGAEEGPPFKEGEHIVKNCGKMILLDKLLKRMKEKGSRVLVFCQMTRQLDIIEDFLHLRKYNYCRIDGQCSGEDRDTAISEFNKEDSEKFVFLLSTRAGGLGINLATADIVILYDSDWNPQVDLQAQDRAHRIGQKKQVLIYRFITEGTIEEKIIEKAESKLYLDALVIQQGRFVEKQKGVNKEDLMKMITFGADHIFESGKDVEDLSEKDIDEILMIGEKKTEEISQKYKTNKMNLANFSMGEGEGTNFYTYGGVDYSKNVLKNIVKKNKEDSKKEIEEEENKNEMRKLRTFQSKKFGALPPNFPKVYDFQFYPKKLYTLLEKEKSAWTLKRPLLIEQACETEIAERRYKRDNSEENEKKLESLKKKYNKKLKETKDLTKEERLEKKELLKQGFPNWNTKDFQLFIRLSSTYGRDNFKKLIDKMTGKTEKEFMDYHATFWKEYGNLKDWKKHITTIEDGENKNKRHLESLDSLHKFITSVDNVNKLTYPGSQKKSTWNDKENLFLAVLTNKHGYGNWELFQKIIMEEPQFKFDWWIRSKTPSDLQKRVDVILKTIHYYIVSDGEFVENDDENSADTRPTTTTTKKTNNKRKSSTSSSDSKKKTKTKK